MSANTLPQAPLPPVFGRPLPTLDIRQVVSIETVQLAAARVAWRELIAFYTRLLGFAVVRVDDHMMELRLNAARVALLRSYPPLPDAAVQPASSMSADTADSSVLNDAQPQSAVGMLMLSLKRVDDAILILREWKIAFELIHNHGGITRSIFLRDPAGNDLRLLETRSF